MKSILFGIAIFCLLNFSGFSQDLVPPGTIQIGSNLFYDQNEISNIHYLEFLHYVKIDSSKSTYLNSLPDTTLVVSEHVQFKDTLFTNEIYLRYPKTRYYPVVGLSYEQAVDYCKWRTDVVKKILAREGKLDTTKYSIQYRLPTVQEWIKIAIANDYDFTPTSESLRKMKKATMSRKTLSQISKENNFNLSGKQYEKILIDYLKFHPVHYVENLTYKGGDKKLEKALNSNFPLPASYNLDHSFIYNLGGNVSEMTATKGIAKGGNWQSAEGEISVWDNVKYDKPSALIGFRCICEVKKLSE